MVSNRQKVALIAVIIIVILAELAIAITSNQPKTSEARAMILDANDVQASLGGD